MIHRWIWIIGIIVIAFFSFVLYQKASHKSIEILKYNLAKEACEKIYKNLKLICLENPGTKFSIELKVTEYIKNISFDENRIICYFKEGYEIKEIQCKVQGEEIKYYEKGFIRTLFKDKIYQRFKVTMEKVDWDLIKVNVTPWPE